MIEFHDVCVCYEPQKRHPVQSLDGLTLKIERGDWVFLVGPSGAGKSSLLKLIFAGTRAQSGRILVDGEDITAISHRDVPALRRKIGIVFQDFQLLNEKTAWENVAFTLRVIGTPQNVIVREVPRALETVGLTHRAEAFPHELSGGEQQRIAIARAIVNDPKILLADEPTGNLDPQTAKEVGELLTKINRERGTTIVMATHDRVFVDNLARRVVRLNLGKVVKDENPGTYEEKSSAPKVDDTAQKNDAFLKGSATATDLTPPGLFSTPLVQPNETKAEEVRAAEARAKEIREAEARAKEARAAEIRAAELRAEAEAREAEIRAVEARAAALRAEAARRAEIEAAEAREAEARAAEARAEEARAAMARIAEAKAAEAREAAEEARAEEARAAMARIAEAKAAEAREDAARRAEERAAEIRAEEVRIAEAKAAEARAAELLAAQQREAEERAALARAAAEREARARAEEERAAAERAAQERAEQERAAARAAAELEAARARAAEIRAEEIRAAEERAREARAAEIRAAEMRAAEIRVAEAKAAQEALAAQERLRQQSLVAPPTAPTPTPPITTARVVTSEPAPLEYSAFDRMLEESAREAETPARPPQFMPTTGSWVAGNVTPEAYDSYDAPTVEIPVGRPMARRITPSDAPPPPPSGHPLDPNGFVSEADAPVGSPENPIVQYE